MENFLDRVSKPDKDEVDLSSSDLDGSHTIVLRGGEEMGYQGRKKHKTTNALYFTDRQGLPLAMSEPVSGNHHDLYVFMNADAGFDDENLRRICEQKGIIANIAQNKRDSGVDNELYFDPELYKERYSIERTNAWMDSFRSYLCLIDLIVLYPAGLDSII